jgi:hypothetical protein
MRRGLNSYTDAIEAEKARRAKSYADALARLKERRRAMNFRSSTFRLSHRVRKAGHAPTTLQCRLLTLNGDETVTLIIPAFCLDVQ